MKTPISLFLALTALSASALDLSPRFINVTADGITIRRPYFADGDRKYSVTLNVETELVPYENGAQFRFVKLRNSDMLLRPSTFSVDVKFDADTIGRYERAARSLLPTAAEDVVLEKQTPNPLPMNGWKSHQFVYKYRTVTGEFRESVTFLNITPTAQAVLQVYAPENDFVDASERAFDIIRRWHELDERAVLKGS